MQYSPYAATAGASARAYRQLAWRHAMPARRPLAMLVSALVLSAPLTNVFAADEGAESDHSSARAFDIEVLKSRGIDPKLAEYFSQAPRYRDGEQIVTLIVNGQRRGAVNARFYKGGELCFTRDLLDRAGLVTPKQVSSSTSGDVTDSTCIDFVAAFPQTEVKLLPQREEVSLVVPTESIRNITQDPADYTTGGTGAILNYDLLGMATQMSGGQAGRYFSADTEVGFNAGDWIVRSRQMYSADDTKSQFSHIYAYGQRTYTGIRSIVQVGQLNIGNSIFSGAPITGVQILPETALTSDGGRGAQVEGIAQSQARIEVRQLGALIYSTVVPAGPFSLDNLPLLNSGSDLTVTVIETNGARREFVVPAASIRGAQLTRPGYSFAIGKVRNIAGDNNNGPLPWVATGTGGWLLNKNWAATAGLMTANTYQAIGWGIDSVPLPGTAISFRNLLSNATREGVRGAQASLSMSTQLGNSLTGSVSLTQQTIGYRDLTDTTWGGTASDLTNGRYKGQYTASIGWSHPVVGAFTTSYSHVTTFSGDTTRRVVGSWGKTFRYATVSLNIEKSLGQTGGGRASGNAVYASVSIPLGRRSVRTYVNSEGGRSRYGVNFSEQVNDMMNYNVMAERTSENQQTNLSGNLALLPRYTRVNLGYARYGASSSYTGQVQGGLVAHRQGVTFSPYQIGDTFGVLSVGEVSGVKVSTPYGPVWTDKWGRAVLAQLQPYQSGRVEIATRTLPRNVDIGNGFQTVDPGRGSVNEIGFNVIKTRRILLKAQDERGQILPKGASVIGKDNRFVTTVVDNGQIFLTNSQPGDSFTVSMPDDSSCALKYTLPVKPDVNAYFENAEAVCRDIKSPQQGVQIK